MRIDIKDPTTANRAISRGIALDYEFKKVYQYIPKRRAPIEQQEKRFYKEKASKLPLGVVFRASKEASEPPTQEEDWVLVEGTQKRRQKTAPKGRGRPKAFGRVDNSHGNIDKFVIPATLGSLTPTPEIQAPSLEAQTPILETQAPAPSPQEPLESMNVD